MLEMLLSQEYVNHILYPNTFLQKCVGLGNIFGHVDKLLCHFIVLVDISKSLNQ